MTQAPEPRTDNPTMEELLSEWMDKWLDEKERNRNLQAQVEGLDQALTFVNSTNAFLDKKLEHINSILTRLAAIDTPEDELSTIINLVNDAREVLK